jgi:tartrate dehydrogenase/decarboxylase/D-malate dehydrogenase
VANQRLAIIAGDGIGPEVIDAADLVLQVVADRFGVRFDATRFNWSCDRYLTNGSMMPADGIEQLRAFDAILLGAVGWPARVPDSVSLHGLLLPIRKAFDLYVNARPHRLLAGVRGPLRAENFDILCIRENTEGEYSGAGGRVHQGGMHEVAVETSVFTRRGVERILRHAFNAARGRRGMLASVTKSNAQKHSMVFWDEVTDLVAQDYPDVTVTRYHIDAIAARFVTAPQTLDVVVASNLFGDILTDLGAAIQGGLGFAASANINPAGGAPSMFEPVHGSAPDIAGKGIANPLASILTAGMMLDFLNERQAADLVNRAVAQILAERKVRTPDMGGHATTRQVGDEVMRSLQALRAK